MTTITKVPLPGGSARIPTGALQFENDWPGLFIRGDEAMVLHARIRDLEQRLEGHPDVAVTAALIELEELADIIERDVIVSNKSA